ncbi:MAG TPA: DUF4919 domain-containing protein [Longimicrobiaceae bacterium]|nr:DUF4919 domain-containing protein [Longimicrobiaceae bacterium]
MRLTLATVSAALLLAAPAAAQQTKAQADSTFAALSARLQQGDTTVDFTAFRMARAHSSAYAPYDAPNAAKHFGAYVQGRRFDALRAAADTVLQADFASIEAHVMRGYAAAQLGDARAAWLHRAIARGLVRSLEASGDGTREHPYVVISVAEEYALVNSRGLQRGEQSLGRCGAVECDVLSVIDADGKGSLLHFDITLPSQHLRAMFQGKS